MKIDLQKIIKKLGKENRIFQSEAQFQFELAWQIQKKYPNYKVSLEVLSACETNNKKPKRFYSDIIISDKTGNYIVIELKYKTKYNIYEDLGITLLNHGATDLGRFDFLWDVHRIELLKKKDENLFKFNKILKNFIKGYAILLTNEKNYWSVSKENNTYLYRDFCLSNNDSIKKGSVLNWNKNSNNSCVDNTFRNVSLCFENNYNFKWEPYCKDFKYLLLEI